MEVVVVVVVVGVGWEGGQTGPRGGGRKQHSCAAEFNCDSSSIGDAIRLRGIKQMKIGPLHSPQAAPRPRQGAARGRWLDLRGKRARG